MDRIEVRQLIDTLEREAAPDHIVASDGDRTLWRGDISDALFLEFVRSESVREVAAPALHREAQTHDIDVAASSPSKAAHALFDAFQGGRYPEARALEMMAWVYAGWTAQELDPLIDEVFANIDFAGAIRPELLEVLAWAGQRGVPGWLVSASPQFLVVRAAAVIGIPTERVVGMAPAVDQAADGARLQPRLAGTATYADGKLTRLHEETQRAPLLAAFGDSGFDGALLRAAANPIAVAPSQSLRDEAVTIPNLLELRLAGD